jgi:Family of unknown function (DUF5343)
MPDNPPFMNATGNLSKILDKIKQAQTPDRFSQDYLGSTLGFASGSSRPFIPLAKRLGLLGSDGTPTELYRRFRNSSESKAAMAEAIRKGYSDLYKVNENVHNLNKADLNGLVAQVTGLEANSSTLRAIVGTFEVLKSYADFTATPGAVSGVEELETPSDDERRSPHELRLSTTIYLNLPNTSDIAVFNAIFKSLREHILS